MIFLLWVNPNKVIFFFFVRDLKNLNITIGRNWSPSAHQYCPQDNTNIIGENEFCTLAEFSNPKTICRIKTLFFTCHHIILFSRTQ